MFTLKSGGLLLSFELWTNAGGARVHITPLQNSNFALYSIIAHRLDPQILFFLCGILKFHHICLIKGKGKKEIFHPRDGFALLGHG